MSKTFLFGVGLFSLALSLTCTATPTVILEITGDFSAHTWSVYAIDSAADNAGLATYGIDVIGYGGYQVLTSKARAPRGFNADQGLASGFATQVSNGVAGVEITASQALAYAGANDPTQDVLVFQHVGQVAGSQDGATWAQPVLIANGTYADTTHLGEGELHVTVHPGDQVQVLASVTPAGDWQGPGNVLTANVIPGVWPTPPEPTCLGWLGFGTTIIVRRTRLRRPR